MSTTKTSEHHHHAHHFRDADHEFDASKLGVWLFLTTEILMFGGLFVGYAIFHGRYPEVFAAGAKFLDWRLGATNTVVLLVSSFTMALGIYYSQTNQRKKAVWSLLITLICAGIFMVIKYLEYQHKFHLGAAPGNFFDLKFDELPESLRQIGLTGPTLPEHLKELPMYFGFYFLMTGLHGSHVIVGMGLIIWVLLRARKDEFNAHYYTPVEGVGLFWHLVDLIWIFLFPLLYLIG